MVVSVPKLALLLFLGAVFFAPELEGRLRFEDMLTPLIAPVLVVYLLPAVRAFPVSIFLFPTYSLLVALIYVSFSTLNALSVVIAFKQFQYYLLAALAALAVYHTRNPRKNLILYLSLIVAACVLSAATSLLLGITGFYGIDFWNEVKGPSNSTLAYLAGVVAAFTLATGNVLLSKKLRRLSLVLGFLCVFFVFLVATRTAAILGLFWLLILTLYVLNDFRVVFSAASMLAFITFAVLIGVFSFLNFGSGENHLSQAIEVMVSRSSQLSDFWATLERSRLFIWRKDFQDYLNASPLFGCGVGCAARSEDAILRLQADNQYLRMLKENGIFGLLIWLFGLFTCWRLMFGGLRRIYAVFLVSFLLAGMTQEVFLLSKGGQVFWIITGLLLGFSLSQGNGTRAEESAMIRGCRPKGIAV